MSIKSKSLIQKYNVPGPRYTSYPTVPYWENNLNEAQWKLSVKQTFQKSNQSKGISLYIHLPFCESLCTYCACNTRITVNHQVEMPYINSLLKEWQLYLELFDETPRIQEVHLGGGTPTFFKAKNLAFLMEEIFKTAHLAPDAELSFEGHPNNTTFEHMQTLYSLGFRRISFGIQDFDLEVQKTINRIQPFSMVQKVTQQAQWLGYTSINYDLVYGLPKQTKSSILKTIEQVNYLHPDRIAFYSYAHVPQFKPSQKSFSKNDLPTGEEKRVLYELGREFLERSGYIEIGMDHFALPSDTLAIADRIKQIHRNFMGYTSQKTDLLIGLGASSISDAWNSFAQNIKKVEDYQKTVQGGKLPFFRGHLLNEEDLVLRKHILNLMCKGETSWGEEAVQTEQIYKALEELKEVEKDELIKIQPYSLKIQPEGKAFLRNICMAFDARLMRKKSGAKVFSQTV